MTSAIATVVIGDEYRRHYEKIFMPSVQRYADRFGYELVHIYQPLCPKEWQHPSTISFNKLYIPFQPEMRAFERLMVLDADILVHPSTPPFTDLELDGGIGVGDGWSQPSVEEGIKFQQKHGWETHPEQYYALAGFSVKIGHAVNSGMFICSPRKHREFFADIAARHIAVQYNHPRGLHYEQSVLGYELWQARLTRLLPFKWNRIWRHYRPDDCTRPADKLRLLRRFSELFDQSYCFHLTMGVDHDLGFVLRNR
jgi:hypothetical protein